jgi:hypothetical protein
LPRSCQQVSSVTITDVRRVTWCLNLRNRTWQAGDFQGATHKWYGWARCYGKAFIGWLNYELRDRHYAIVRLPGRHRLVSAIGTPRSSSRRPRRQIWHFGGICERVRETSISMRLLSVCILAVEAGSTVLFLAFDVFMKKAYDSPMYAHDSFLRNVSMIFLTRSDIYPLNDTASRIARILFSAYHPVQQDGVHCA